MRFSKFIIFQIISVSQKTDIFEVFVPHHKTMRSKFLSSVFIVLAFIAFNPYKSEAQQTPVSDSVNFCDLLKEPKKYDGKKVTVRATYRYGFEWQEIYCLECRNLGKVWLEIGDITSKSGKIFNNFSKNDGTINGIFTGVFQSSEAPFGDGGYKFRFWLEEISKPELLTKSGGDPQQLPDNIRKRICNN